MTIRAPPPSYRGFRFPQEIISHVVWLSFRFNLSYRDVEEMLAERGIVVTYATIRQWARKFGQPSANQLRQRRAQPGDGVKRLLTRRSPLVTPFVPFLPDPLRSR